jgi:hypothetical protein
MTEKVTQSLLNLPPQTHMTEKVTQSLLNLPPQTLDAIDETPFGVADSLSQEQFNELVNAAPEDIRRLATELGVPVNKGTVKLLVDGELRRINTAEKDFGTSVRNLGEREVAIDELASRKLGSGVLNLIGIETTAKDDGDTDASKGEIVIIPTDQFNLQLDGAIRELSGQSAALETSLVTTIEDIEASTGLIRGQFVEVDQQLNMMIRALYEGQSDTTMRLHQLSNIQELLDNSRMRIRNQTTQIDDAENTVNSLQGGFSIAASALQTEASKFTAEITERIYAARETGAIVDDGQIQIALSRAGHIGHLLRQMEDAVGAAKDETRHTRNEFDEYGQSLCRVSSMIDEVKDRLRYTTLSPSDIEGVYGMVRPIIANYDEHALVSITRIAATADEIVRVRTGLTSLV